MAVFTYDANQVTIAISGIPITGGFADGEFLTIEPSEDGFTEVVGTSGEVVRSKTFNRTATVTLRFLQTAEANDFLGSLYETDYAAPNGAGIGAFAVRDLNGTALYTAPNCWIKRRPTATFGREATEREWVIMVDDLKVLGG